MATPPTVGIDAAAPPPIAPPGSAATEPRISPPIGSTFGRYTTGGPPAGAKSSHVSSGMPAPNSHQSAPQFMAPQALGPVQHPAHAPCFKAKHGRPHFS